VLREGLCPSLPAARASGARHCNPSVPLMSGSRQPKARPGRESLSLLAAPGLSCPREPVPTVLEKDLSRSRLPWALLSGNRLRRSRMPFAIACCSAVTRGGSSVWEVLLRSRRRLGWCSHYGGEQSSCPPGSSFLLSGVSPCAGTLITQDLISLLLPLRLRCDSQSITQSA